MELSLLTAIVKFRRSDEWKNEFVNSLEEICDYKFIPIISREGAAFFPLLMGMPSTMRLKSENNP